MDFTTGQPAMETLEMALDKTFGEQLDTSALVQLMCRRLHFQCKISVIVYNWSAGHGFPGLFHAIFDNDSSHRPFAFGISHVGMNQERLEMAHLMDNFLDLKFVITVPENDLLRSEAEEAILPALAKIATLETWSIVFVIYGLYAVLLAKFSDARSRSSFAALITRTWNAAYKLFAVSVSQDDIIFRRLILPSRAGLYVVWLLWATMVVSALNSFLPFILTVSRMELPFTNLESLLMANYTLLGSTLEYKQLNGSLDRVAQLAGHRMTVLDDAMNVRNYARYLRKRGEVGPAVMDTLGSHVSFKDVSQCTSTIIAIPTVGRLMGSAMFTTKNSPYRRLFDHEYLVLLEHGFLQHLKAMADEPGSLSHCNCTRQQIDRCRPKKFMRSTPLSGPRPIGLKNVRFLMWLILGGLSFSFFVFVMERVSDPMRPNF